MSIYARKYQGTKQCTEGGQSVGGYSVRQVYGCRWVQCTAGGVRQVVYGRWCTEGRTASDGRLVIINPCSVRRPGSGWCFMARCSSPMDLCQIHGYHCTFCHEAAPTPRAQTDGPLGRGPACSVLSGYGLVSAGACGPSFTSPSSITSTTGTVPVGWGADTETDGGPCPSISDVAMGRRCGTPSRTALAGCPW